MPYRSLVVDANGCPVSVEDGGLVVSTQERESYQPLSIPLVDSSGSPLMNVDGSAGGASDGIHDGTDSVLWTASALSGTWDFASTAQAKAGTRSIDATGTTGGDQALLSRGSAITAGTYTVFTGSIYLTSFNAAKNEITVQFRLAGVPDGIDVNIGDYIDAGTLNAWQDFSIPLSIAGVSGDIDEMVVTTVVSSGSNPNYYLDELKLQESGALAYSTNLTEGQKVQYKRVDFTIADNVTVVSYDALLGLAALSNGITFRRVNNSEVITAGSISTLGDMLAGGGTITDQVTDTTNTMLKISLMFEEWATLNESNGDALEVVVNDDLSSLLDFKVFIIGREVL